MRSQAKAIVAVSAMLLTFALGASSAFAEPPTVSIDPNPTAGYVTAQVSGEVDPKDVGTWWSYEYAIAGSGNWSGFGWQGFIEANEPAQSVPYELTGLQPGTDYEVRLVANNWTDPEVVSAIETFTTGSVSKPTLVLDPVSSITTDSAHLSGSVDTNGPDATGVNASCFFEYITDAAYQPRDELQRLQIKANGGTFTLELGGQITAPIAHNASPATVQAAIEALPSFDPGDLSVSGGPGNLNGTNPYLLTFFDTDVNPWADPNSLLAPGKASVTTLVEGFTGQNEVQRLTVAADSGTYTLSFTLGASSQTTAPLAFDASAATVQAALEALASIGPGDVVVSGGPGDINGSSPYEIAFGGALGNANHKPITSNAGNLGGRGEGEAQPVINGRDEGFSGAPQVPCQPSETVKGPGSKPVEADLMELEPGTTYHVRLRAENAAGVSTADGTFKTVSLSSTAITHLVANLMPTTARLTGFVDPQSEPTAYYFEWGTQPDLSGAQSMPPTEDASAGAGDRQISVGQDLNGLNPGATYYYRLVSDNPTGLPAVGQIRSFTTRATPPPMGKGVGAFGDRVLERVSAPDTSGNSVGDSYLSVDGSRALYRVFGGMPGTEFGETSLIGAERTASGWVPWKAQPPRSAIPYDGVYAPAWTPDMSRLLFAAGPHFGDTGQSQFFTYGPFDGFLEENSVPGEPSQNYQGADDLTHFFYAADEPLTPSDPSTDGGLYDYSTNPPQLVGLLPGNVAPTCGLIQEEFPFHGQRSDHWSSDDGRRLYFHSRGSGDCGSTPAQLYMREAGPSGSLAAGSGATTTLISGPVLSGPDTGADPLGQQQLNGFVRATPDGSSVVFKTEQVLDTDDANSTRDLYRFTVGKGNECITCFAPQVEPQLPKVSEDLSHVYFRSRRVLAPGGVAGQPNLYMWRADSPGEAQFVAPGGQPSLMSPDGSTLLIVEGGPSFDALTANDSSSGFDPLYRFDEAERSITCVTCLPGGSSVKNEGVGGEDHPSLSRDGDIFVFVTKQALVAEDVNDAHDLYEWREGKIGLISDGATPHTGTLWHNVYLQSGVSPNGRDVLFKSPNALLPSGSDTTPQLYDARIGGGFPNPEPPAPCGGDLCQGAPTPPPPTESSGTSQFSGPGNQTKKPTPKCSKGKVRKRGSCVKKSKSKKRASKNSKKANANRGGGK